MLKIRILSLLLCCLTVLTGSALAAEVDSDARYCFQCQDFSQKEEPLRGICITRLPENSTGTVMLGTRVLRPGDILTAAQLEQLTFCPVRREQDGSAQLCYLPIYENRVEKSAAMTIAIRGKEDKAPVAEDSMVETYKNIPNEGKLKVSDPEQQKLTYTMCRGPRRGTVELDGEGGFTYTPKKNKVGVDSFTFTAADPAGHVSREATVTVQILKPANAHMYTDTADETCRFEAEWLKNAGLFEGEKVSGQNCFFPEKPVSRGQFLAMMEKLLNIPEQQEVLSEMPENTPRWLQPYLASAVRSGLLEGVPDLQTGNFDAPITGAEAAVMLQNALDLKGEAVISQSEEEQAVPALAIMEKNGVTLRAEEPLTRAEAAETLYKVSYLALEAPGTSIFRMQN